MARPRIHDAELRTRLLEAAAETVARHGVDSLSLRKLAAAQGTSTTAIYSLFGGRAELLVALFGASFSSFGDAQRSVPVTGESEVDLRELAFAYRRWVMANPHLYAVMFGGVLGSVDVSDQAHLAAAAMDPLRAAVASAVEAGTMSGASVDVISHSFWAIVHGLVSLELSIPGMADDEDRRVMFDAGAASVLRGWMRQ
ncbi:TetR/AcrR family transcriptional regulator [Rhodococcoides fascians]|uniref:TetR/AcrR family transcriptional regulator n=1 Tax=Rhodococcoides fascians TaxID=1828 RepID=UPI00050C3D83|nr:TetR/AcrR family transcriptional regulator [Rhodococcus fascians]MBY4380504.1 TetR/AcrR family transcriptional regulator [Rhodococcus fascians]MBY4395029.1 TetR/AcrR family transcriptional regulator [Rhodococcus fascians]MBY4405230.1 TetR/AcrR family transcriptional regulator [Rhodococcus fascians]MBY4419653.1 TetR/AcrR family transcriptional regulator [Rhodococcus fascians]MBY4459099.1 TetR/AcrR family transcriptional regulator [Rhodococcus fascians]